MNNKLAIEPLRIMEIQDYDLAVKVIDCIFEEVILRYNPSLEEKDEKYGFLSKEKFVEVLKVISSLSTFVVTRNLHINAIEDAIYQNVRLSNCQNWKKLYEWHK